MENTTEITITRINEENGVFYWEDADGNEHREKVPTTWAICSTCHGNGKHSLAVDGHGITQEERERDWDDESWQNYLDGAYDKTCEDCGGSGKYRHANFDNVPERFREALEEYWESEADYWATVRAEKAFGC